MNLPALFVSVGIFCLCVCAGISLIIRAMRLGRTFPNKRNQPENHFPTAEDLLQSRLRNELQQQVRPLRQPDARMVPVLGHRTTLNDVPPVQIREKK